MALDLVLSERGPCRVVVLVGLDAVGAVCRDEYIVLTNCCCCCIRVSTGVPEKEDWAVGGTIVLLTDGLETFFFLGVFLFYPLKGKISRFFFFSTAPGTSETSFQARLTQHFRENALEGVYR